MRFVRLNFLFLVFIFFSNFLSAQTWMYPSVVFSGGKHRLDSLKQHFVNNNNVFKDSVEDDHYNFYINSNDPDSLVNLSLINEIEVGIDRSYHKNTPSYKCKFLFEIEGYDVNNVRTVFNKELDIAYNPNKDIISNDLARLTFSGFIKFTYKLISFKLFNETTSYFEENPFLSIPNNLFIESRIHAYRYSSLKYLNPKVNYVSAIIDTFDGLIKITWDNGNEIIPQPGWYEIEWKHIAWPMDGINLASIDCDNINFEIGASRISTFNNYYNIPFAYNVGYLVYRIRRVRPQYNDLSLFNFGPWSYDFECSNSTSLEYSYFPNNVRITKDLYEKYYKNKNWSFQTSYSEWGNSVSEMNYFDGSNRVRQKLSTSSTLKNYIIAQNPVYNFAGNFALDVLPAPVFSKSFYLKKFVNKKKNSNYSLSAEDFDLNSPNLSICNLLTPELDDFTPAGVYYGDDHSSLDIANSQYLPNAGNKPFSIKLFSPDGSNRIIRQGGVGSELQLGSGKDVTFDYSNPFQVNLDKWFGAEIGFSSFYRKQILLDNNGQLSYTYTDQKGRVIATSIDGNSPNSLNPLSTLDYDTLRIDLLENKDWIATSNGFFHSSRINLKSGKNIWFDYRLLGSTYSKLYDSLKNICLECQYTISLDIIDPCGNVIYGFSNFRLGKGGDSIYSISSFCSNDSRFYVYPISNNSIVSNDTTFNLVKLNILESGSYTIQRRILPIGISDTTAFKIALIDTNVPSLSNWRKLELDKLDFNSCLPEWPRGECESIKERMIADLTPPYGKYAECEIDPITNLYRLKVSTPVTQQSKFVSIFDYLINVPNSIDQRGFIKNYTTDYFLVNGELVRDSLRMTKILEYFANLAGLPSINISILSTLLNRDTFIDTLVRNYSRELAEKLLPVHPLAQNYSACVALNSGEVASFQNLLLSTNSYKEAYDKGLINIAGLSTVDPNLSYPLDPIVNYIYKLNNFTTLPSGTNTSITVDLFNEWSNDILNDVFSRAIPNSPPTHSIQFGLKAAALLTSIGSLCNNDKELNAIEAYFDMNKDNSSFIKSNEANLFWNKYKTIYLRLREDYKYLILSNSFGPMLDLKDRLEVIDDIPLIAREKDLYMFDELTGANGPVQHYLDSILGAPGNVTSSNVNTLQSSSSSGINSKQDSLYYKLIQARVLSVISNCTQDVLKIDTSSVLHKNFILDLVAFYKQKRPLLNALGTLKSIVNNFFQNSNLIACSYLFAYSGQTDPLFR